MYKKLKNLAKIYSNCIILFDKLMQQNYFIFGRKIKDAI